MEGITAEHAKYAEIADIRFPRIQCILRFRCFLYLSRARRRDDAVVDPQSATDPFFELGSEELA
jgi:hypothetical protein